MTIVAGEFLIREPLPGDPPEHGGESLGIVHVYPIVVAERLLIDVFAQVERLDANVGSVQSALEETPEVLHRVGVDVAVSVFDGVVDDGVLIVTFQTIVGFQFIAEDRRALRRAVGPASEVPSCADCPRRKRARPRRAPPYRQPWSCLYPQSL